MAKSKTDKQNNAPKPMKPVPYKPIPKFRSACPNCN